MSVSPVRDGRKARRNITKESRKITKSRKDSKTKVVISITHTAETSMRKSVRERRTVEVKEKRTKNGALWDPIEKSKRRR